MRAANCPDDAGWSAVSGDTVGLFAQGGDVSQIYLRERRLK